ncbi:MAG: DUF4358 domain-containing protein [Erysipelotrichaceae bacterium]|nr:DUF4358 domain-containing protein [Erysipelotrichaceae bacterium]
MKRFLVILALMLALTGCGSASAGNETKVLTNEEWADVMTGIQTDMEMPALMNLADTEVTDFLGINTENLESFTVQFPMMMVHSTAIMVLQAKDGMIDTVKEEVGTWLSAYEEQWSTYLPDQYELVKNRVEKQVGDSTYVVIIAEEAAAIEEKIDAALAE